LNKNTNPTRTHEPRTPASFLQLQTLSTLRNADDFFSAWCFIAAPAIAQLTNSAAAPVTAYSHSDTTLPLLNVMGALALVIGIFLGGVWLFRNWQRLAF